MVPPLFKPLIIIITSDNIFLVGEGRKMRQYYQEFLSNILGVVLSKFKWIIQYPLNFAFVRYFDEKYRAYVYTFKWHWIMKKNTTCSNISSFLLNPPPTPRNGCLIYGIKKIHITFKKFIVLMVWQMYRNPLIIIHD